MSVADHLGLWGETSELLALPDQYRGHSHWATAHPALTNRCGVLDLRSWLRGSHHADAGRLVTLECVDVVHRAGRCQPGGCLHEKTRRARQTEGER
jgi:hypothetical protein